MAWPIDDLNTSGTDQGTDTPPRAMFNTLITRVKELIAGRGTANGICELDASSQVPISRIPDIGSANGICDLDGSTKVPVGYIPTLPSSIFPFNTGGTYSWTSPDGVKLKHLGVDRVTTNSSGILVGGICNATTLQESGVNLSSKYLAISGNAVSATTLNTARSFQLTGDVTSPSYSFDGSGNVTFVATVGNNSHTHDDTTIDNLDASAITTGTFDAGLIPTLNQSTTGNAATATALQTSRSISLVGDVSGSVNFNGTANVSITTVVSNNSHDHDGSTLSPNLVLSGTTTTDKVRILDETDITLAGTDAPWQLGATSSSNIIMDGTDVQRRTNGVAGTLNLNRLGGTVACGAALTCTSWTATSDRRKKKNIQDLTVEECRDILDKVRWVNFDWNNGLAKNVAGVVAQELQNIHEGLVTLEEDGYYSANYMQLYNMQMRVSQEDNKRLDKLEKLVESLVNGNTK